MLCWKDLIQDFTVDANAVVYSCCPSLTLKRLLCSIAFQLAIQFRWLKQWVFLSENKKTEVYKCVLTRLEFCDASMHLYLYKYRAGKVSLRLDISDN
jgi:hypothetical protein